MTKEDTQKTTHNKEHATKSTQQKTHNQTHTSRITP